VDRPPWREALAEAGLLALFMAVACAVGVLLGHPAAAARVLVPDPLARRALFGLAMAVTILAIVHSPAGKRSGAHLNPAVTLAFVSLGRVRAGDAAWYVAAQAAGAAAGVLLAWGVLGTTLAHPEVHFVTTRPGPGGPFLALAAEVAISFLLMATVLLVSASRHAAWTGACAATLVFAFITLEAPLSGMSMNPARSLGSAVVAGEGEALWVYLVAPPVGMLWAAATLRRRVAGLGCAKLCHPADVPCRFCGQAPAGARNTDLASANPT